MLHRLHTLCFLLVSAWAATCAGCSDDSRCGPGKAATGDVVVADLGTSGVVLRFHELVARANNDCPAVDAPAGVVSLTISGTAVNGRLPLTLCIPRPDLLGGARQLGADVQVVDVVGEDAGCTYRQLRPSAPSGSVTGSGVCGNGRDAAGFALDFAGEVSIERTCGTVRTTLRMTMTGLVAVLPSSS
jgi:hypothetical protein